MHLSENPSLSGGVVMRVGAQGLLRNFRKQTYFRTIVGDWRFNGGRGGGSAVCSSDGVESLIGGSSGHGVDGGCASLTQAEYIRSSFSVAALCPRTTPALPGTIFVKPLSILSFLALVGHTEIYISTKVKRNKIKIKLCTCSAALEAKRSVPLHSYSGKAQNNNKMDSRGCTSASGYYTKEHREMRVRIS